MSFTFFIEDTGNAFVQGNLNLIKVIPISGDSALSFVEPLTTGSIQSTTISNNGQAVHSRHTTILGEFAVSQWHGKCTFFEGKS